MGVDVFLMCYRHRELLECDGWQGIVPPGRDSVGRFVGNWGDLEALAKKIYGKDEPRRLRILQAFLNRHGPCRLRLLTSGLNDEDNREVGLVLRSRVASVRATRDPWMLFSFWDDSEDDPVHASHRSNGGSVSKQPGEDLLRRFGELPLRGPWAEPDSETLRSVRLGRM